MNPHLEMLADVIVELAAREIETPSFETRRDDGLKDQPDDDIPHATVAHDNEQ